MARSTNRRKFLQETAALGVGLWVAGGVQAKQSVSANERIRFACIGVKGKGDSDSSDAAKHGDVVAACDIDDKRLDLAVSAKFSQATLTHADFSHAELAGADFTGASLFRTKFHLANRDKAILPRAAGWIGEDEELARAEQWQPKHGKEKTA